MTAPFVTADKHFVTGSESAVAVQSAPVVIWFADLEIDSGSVVQKDADGNLKYSAVVKEEFE